MRRLFQQIEALSESDATVLVQGETGVGKELVARALHRLGPRRRGPFVAVDVGRLEDDRFASELFGRVETAPDGTLLRYPGLAEAADGGTLFLDEVEDLSPVAQSELVRFLDRREVRSQGAAERRRVDVRVLAASRIDLRRQMRLGVLRSDLYFRLRGLTLTVPALRERTDDVPLLALHFVQRFAARFGKEVAGVDDDVLEALVADPWHGNVRELENEIQRAVVLLPPRGRLSLDTLSREVAARRRSRRPSRRSRLKERSRIQERKLVEAALESCGWNIAAAARRLELSRGGLAKKMKALGIFRPARLRAVGATG